MSMFTFKTRLLSVFMLASLLAALPTSSAEAQATIIYVDQDATTGANNGTSWADAYTDLQSALAAASSETEIWVAQGTYKPTSGADRTATFQMQIGVAIYGGFDGTETALTERDPVTNVTTLSGDIGTLGDSDNSYHVVTSSGTNSTAILDGFTVTGGNANGSSPDDQGGGMFNQLSSPALTDVTFEGNSALEGGGMFNSQLSSPTLTNIIFGGNSAIRGGGMYNYISSPTLTHVLFVRNSATGNAGGMYNNSSSPVLMNVIFSSNSATYYGGGMLNNDTSSNPTLTDVTFSGNSANFGGGMYNQSSSPTLTNVTFSSNLANTHGGGLYSYNSSSTLTNVTFSSNSATEYGGGMFNYISSPTLTNITFGSNSAYRGGGMYNTESNPSLTNVTFDSNSANDRAGGMYNAYSSPTLTDVTFSGNSANFGGGMFNELSSSPTLTNVTFNGNSATGSVTSTAGGMYNNSSSPVLMNVTFSGNSANFYGGGMLNYISSPTLTNVTFSSNSANSSAGGMFNQLSSPTLTNVTFSSNSANGAAGGMYNTESNPTLTNVTFSGNSAGSSGGGMLNIDSSNPTIRNTILWGNTASTGAQVYNDSSTPTINYSVVQGGCPAGSTCLNIITSDPLLGPIGDYGGSTETIPLLPGSSAINAGNDANCPSTDQRGVARPQGPHCDIGAYEVTPPGAATLTSPTGDIGANYTPAYTWNKENSATWYYLWINGPSGNIFKQWYQASAICSGDTCTVTPAGIALGGGDHTWWVQTYNAAGDGPWSIGMAFSTTMPTIPGAATLTSPTGDIGTNYTPAYAWNEVAGVTWYYLWVNGPSGNVIKQWYQASVVCSGGTCSVMPTTTLGGGAHTWWVQTWNAAGYGPWSSGMSFTTTIPTVPGAATLISPNGSIGTNNPTYTWNTVSGAAWYYLWVNGPSGNVIKQWYQASVVCSGGTCTVTPDTTLASGAHTWWVQTYNNAGYGPWSSEMNFSVP